MVAITIRRVGNRLELEGQWPPETAMAPDVLALPSFETTITIRLSNGTATYRVTGVDDYHNVLARLIGSTAPDGRGVVIG